MAKTNLRETVLHAARARLPWTAEHSLEKLRNANDDKKFWLGATGALNKLLNVREIAKTKNCVTRGGVPVVSLEDYNEVAKMGNWRHTAETRGRLSAYRKLFSDDFLRESLDEGKFPRYSITDKCAEKARQLLEEYNGKLDRAAERKIRHGDDFDERVQKLLDGRRKEFLLKMLNEIKS